LLDFETLQKANFRVIGKQIAAAWNDVAAKHC